MCTISSLALAPLATVPQQHPINSSIKKNSKRILNLTTFPFFFCSYLKVETWWIIIFSWRRYLSENIKWEKEERKKRRISRKQPVDHNKFWHIFDLMCARLSREIRNDQNEFGLVLWRWRGDHTVWQALHKNTPLMHDAACAWDRIEFYSSEWKKGICVCFYCSSKFISRAVFFFRITKHMNRSKYLRLALQDCCYSIYVLFFLFSQFVRSCAYFVYEFFFVI